MVHYEIVALSPDRNVNWRRRVKKRDSFRTINGAKIRGRIICEIFASPSRSYSTIV